MAAVTPGARLITGEELARMPDVGPCELIEGRVVPVSPGGFDHSVATTNVFQLLDVFVRSRRLGLVLTGEVGLYTRRAPDTVRGADVVFISAERLERRTRALTFLDAAPELVVEVLSREHTVRDLADKLREYFAADVKIVWVVDPRARRCSLPVAGRAAGADRERYAFRRGYPPRLRGPGDRDVPGVAALEQAERPAQRRWTRYEYARLIDHGVLDEDEPIELLDGLLLVKDAAAQSAPDGGAPRGQGAGAGIR